MLKKLLNENPNVVGLEHAVKVNIVPIGDSHTNLLESVKREKSALFYDDAAKEATEEGFEEFSILFKNLARAEEHHMFFLSSFLLLIPKILKTNKLQKKRNNFKKMADELKSGMFKTQTMYVWRCQKCGHIHMGYEPPEICPICDHEAGLILEFPFHQNLNFFAQKHQKKNRIFRSSLRIQIKMKFSEKKIEKKQILPKISKKKKKIFSCKLKKNQKNFENFKKIIPHFFTTQLKI